MRIWAGVAAVVLGVGVGFGATAGKPAAKKGDAKAAEVVVGKANPLLPVQVSAEALVPELVVVQKVPMIAPEGLEPIYTSEDWGAYRAAFGEEADNLGRKKSSGVAEFAGRMIGAAEEARKAGKGGLARLLCLRAASVCYRNRDGFVVANRAVVEYQAAMDIHVPLQVAGLWAMTNQMSKMAVTPKPERIRYSGIAARANMQLALLLLDADQVEAAQGVIRQIGYHEGWLKSDKAVRAQIAQVRAQVKQTAGLMAELGEKYAPAVKGDDSALMAIYLYGRYVKGRPEIVADLPARKPVSPMAQLAAAIGAADRDAADAFTAAEMLKGVASGLEEGVLKQRTLYAALGYYRAYLKEPRTERERVKRTLARMAVESVIGDGARGRHAIEPMAAATTTQKLAADGHG
jgi:hypothetical protein